MSELMNVAVCVLIGDGCGNVLTVSRKDNMNDVGLPGGKFEQSDVTRKACAVREVFEETGLVIEEDDLTFLYIDKCGEFFVMTFGLTYAVSTKNFKTSESGVVSFQPLDVLLSDTNSFTEYNKKLIDAVKDESKTMCHMLKIPYVASRNISISHDEYNTLPTVIKQHFQEIPFCFIGEIYDGEYFDDKRHKIVKKTRTGIVKKYKCKNLAHVASYLVSCDIPFKFI